MLIRAGREDAARELRLAAAAGVIVLDGEAVRFTPPALAAVLAEDTDAIRRTRIHDALAAAAVDRTDAVRHRALRSGRPDADVARSLAAAAETAAHSAGRAHRGRAVPAGCRPLPARAGRPAARLADRRGRDRGDRRRARARRAGRRGGTGRRRARRAPGPRPPGADRPGRAGAGRHGGDVRRRGVEADGDPALLAPVRLRQTWAAMIGGEPEVAADGRAGPWRTPAGPGIRPPRRWPSARSPRSSGCAAIRGGPGPCARRSTCPPSRCRAGCTWARGTWPPVSPWSTTGSTRPAPSCCNCSRVAEQDRTGEALVEVLRSLSEVATRAGRCRDALRYAHRAVDAAQRAGLSPGPTWYTAAVAELAGGSLARPPDMRAVASGPPSRRATASTCAATCTPSGRPNCGPVTPAPGWPRCAGCATWRRRSAPPIR